MIENFRRRGLRARLLVFALLVVSPSVVAAELEVGQRAPEFRFDGSDGKTYTLSGLLDGGAGGIVLAFFPKAFTPGCTKELISLHESEAALRTFDVSFFMVSLDTPAKNREFAESVGAGFVLLGDPEKKSAEKFGVLGSGGTWTKRWTIYIDGAGVVRKIDREVSPETHGENVVKTLDTLGFPRH